MKIMTDSKIMELANEVVHTYAADILDKLGLSHDNDGILERISVTNEVGVGSDVGMFNHVTITRGLLGLDGCEYEMGSGNIQLNPLQCIHMVKKDTVKKFPLGNFFATLLQNSIKRYLVVILAHELRHYWQFYTGEIFKEGRGRRIGGMAFMPYEWRWEEKDANDWSAQYVKENYKN